MMCIISKRFPVSKKKGLVSYLHKNNTQSNYRLLAYYNLDSKLMPYVTPFNNGYEYIFSITNVVNVDSISPIIENILKKEIGFTLMVLFDNTTTYGL